MPIPIHPTKPRTKDTKLKTGVLTQLVWFCFSTTLYLVYIVAAPGKERHLDKFLLFDFFRMKNTGTILYCIAISPHSTPIHPHPILLSPQREGYTSTCAHTHTILAVSLFTEMLSCMYCSVTCFFFHLKMYHRGLAVSANRTTSLFLGAPSRYRVRHHVYFIIFLMIDSHGFYVFPVPNNTQQTSLYREVFGTLLVFLKDEFLEVVLLGQKLHTIKMPKSISKLLQDHT